MNNMESDILFLQIDHLSNFQYTAFNIGMLSIATLLKKNGFIVKCLKNMELSCLNYSEKKEYLKKLNPKVIGFNINSDNIYNVKYIARDIKKWLPNTIILLGGPLVGIIKDSILNETSFDMAIVGEGEFSTLKLCEKIIKNKGNYENIEGLIYRDKKGKIFMNSIAEPIEVLDILPPIDYSLTNKTRGFSYSSGRGCPYNCSFCFRGVHGKGYRYVSSKRVINDIISTCEKYNSTFVGIMDDTFVANPQRTKEICEGLKIEKANRNLDFALFCEARIDTLYRHPELIPILKNAGFMKIQLGIENGNQEILDAYNKRITIEQIESVVKNLAKQKYICANANIIMGGAFETEKTFDKSLNFAIKLMNLAPGYLEFSPALLCPFPGTDICNNPSKYGLKLIDTKWLKSITLTRPSCTTDSLNVQRIAELNISFLEKIDLEMNKIIARLKFDDINFRISLAKYGIHSLFYFRILEIAPIIQKYFALKNNYSRFRLEEVSIKQIMNSRPLRLKEPSYIKNRYFLSDYLKPVYIDTPVEKAIYDLSNGKLTMIEIAEYVKYKTDCLFGMNEIIDKIMLPFYKRLETSYHILFQL